MRTATTVTGIALLVLGGLATSAGGQAVDGTLHVLKAKARFAHAKGSGDARHMLKLTLMVTPRSLPDFHVPERDDLRVTVDGTTALDAPAGTEGYDHAKGGRWRYHGDVAGGRVKLSANPLSGKIKIKVTGADFADLRQSPAVDLPISLDIAGTTVETAASFAVKDGHVRQWKGLADEFVPRPGPGPGPGPDPDPGPGGGGNVAFSVLAQGINSLVFPKQHQVARTQSEWTALWSRHQPGGTPPSVDFGRDMVVCVFLGIPKKASQTGLTSTIRVVSITDSATGREVLWEEVPDSQAWTCPPPGVGAPCILPDPFQFVLAPQSSRAVTFRER